MPAPISKTRSLPFQVQRTDEISIIPRLEKAGKKLEPVGLYPIAESQMLAHAAFSFLLYSHP
jgi:hypothetical protein